MGVLQALVEQDFGYKHDSGKWGRADSHNSLVVNEQEQSWFWNSEGKKGTPVDYLMEVRGLDFKAAVALLKAMKNLAVGNVSDNDRPDITPYPKLIDAMWGIGKENRAYWYNRCLKDSTIDRHRLGYFNGWNLIPLYEAGRFINFQCRRDDPKKSIRYWYSKKDFSPVLLNSEILSVVNTVYITEGTVDSMLLSQEGIPSVAHSGGNSFWNPAWYHLFGNIDTIYYIQDNDKGGDFAAKLVAKNLGADRVKIFRFDGMPDKFDVVDYFRSGGTTKNFKDMVDTESKHVFEIGELNGTVALSKKSFNKSFKRK